MSDVPNEPDPDEPPEPEPHPAEQRIAKRQNDQAVRELAVVDAGLTLSKEQRLGLLAVVGDDLTPETLKAKAEAMFGTAPEPPGPTPEQLAADKAALDNGARMAAGSSSPVPPVAPMASVWEKAVTINNPAVLAQLLPEAMAAIQQTPGLVFGPADQLSALEPI